jgi:hypothetical protein
VVNLIRWNLAQDVAAIRGVAAKPDTDPVWADVAALGLSPEDTETLIELIRGKINAGENQMASQDMNLEN